MTAKIRLTRVGTKGKPRWRLVTQQETVKRNGKVIEVLGIYDPQIKPPLIKVNQERIKWWQEHGAQISLSAKKIIK